MRVAFDWALDGPAWPGPFGQADFVFGETWVGPMGLIDLLETRLGLGGRFEEPLQRACKLASRLRECSGYWSESFDVDPLGTSRRLLNDRDQLRLWGWAGEPVSRRLAELEKATEDVAPSVPDRLLAIAQALELRPAGIQSLITHTVLDDLPPLWRQVFAALGRAGVMVEEQTLPSAPALGDLAASRSADFAPTGDGRLCLLRRHGPLDTADEIAASLAACDSLDDVVVIGADGVLDQALARHGLPRVGAHVGPPASARLLSLVIASAFHPMPMCDLHALLAADPGPIPRPVARRLVGAIGQLPGRRNATWTDALSDGLERIDPDRRKEIEERLTALVMPVCALDEPLPADALRARLGVLDSWARARSGRVPSLLVLSQRIRTLLEAVDLMATTALPRQELWRLCDDLGEPSWSWQPAQAGLAHLPRPGAVLGPARAIVWWNFTRDSAVRPNRLLLTRAEREGLQAAGIEPPTPAAAMAIQTRAWQRPLRQARDALVLACPLTGADGQPSHPHPLWDDIVASLQKTDDAPKLEFTQVTHLAEAKRAPVQKRSLPTPSEAVTLDSPILLRETESPSSIEKLLGCSLAWALTYSARLGAGLSLSPPLVGPLVFGTLTHRILEQSLREELASPEQAAEVTGRLFDEQFCDICEELGLPQFQASRATVRRAAVESARELFRLGQQHGVSRVRTEVLAETKAADQPVQGRLDLVWEDPAVVLDLKWGKSAYLERLEAGTSIQLAAYAAMHAPGGQLAETGYFVLQNQQLLSEPDGRLSAHAAERGRFRASEVWPATVASLQVRRDSLASGQLEAPGANGEDIRGALTPDGLTVAPPCKYCTFAGLCGRDGAR